MVRDRRGRVKNGTVKSHLPCCLLFPPRIEVWISEMTSAQLA